MTDTRPDATAIYQIIERQHRLEIRRADTFQAWANMLCKCYDPEHPEYPQEGRKGAEVCPAWRDPEHGFDNFIADMGLAPED